MLMNAVRTSLGKTLVSLRNHGIDVRPTTRSSGKISGFRLQWTPDETDLLRGAIVRFDYEGQVVRFFVNDDRDDVQSCHRRGTFYEPEELAIIKAAFPGGSFIDIGANVGNHTIYAGVILHASTIVAIEPGDLAFAILSTNAVLNRLDIELHHCGLADATGNGRVIELYNSNLGGNRVEPDPAGSLELKPGDELLRRTRADFIKIDVETTEMQVLEGLRQTIARDRPVMFVEVDNGNIERFKGFCSQMNYAIDEEFRRYSIATNYLVRPA